MCLGQGLVRTLFPALHPREEGTTEMVSRTFTCKPRPKSGRDCLTCAILLDSSPSVLRSGCDLIPKIRSTIQNRFVSDIPTRDVACFKDNCFTEMRSGSEAGLYLGLIDSCIAQLKAQGPSRTRRRIGRRVFDAANVERQSRNFQKSRSRILYEMCFNFKDFWQ